MYGTLAGALAGRKIPFDRKAFTATVDGRIVGVGRTIKIESITMHYRVTVAAEAREAAERALAVHAQGCPAHESVKAAIAVRWDATLTAGGEEIILRSDTAASTESTSPAA
jgi:uncharacterized OsmC-like protein